MRIFVIGTGRCGSYTFKKACNHITNYTNGHESHTGWDHQTKNLFDFPDNHIEIDCRFSYFIPLLREKYPDALFVHLQRERSACVKSLAKRESTMLYGMFHLGGNIHNWRRNKKLLAGIYYDETNELIRYCLYDYKDYIKITLSSIDITFKLFWDRIGAEGDQTAALKELKIKHNKS